MKVKLESLKRQTYNTRHLEAGDVFEADRKFARVLIAQKRAKESTGEPAKAAQPQPDPDTVPPPPPGPQQDDLAELRVKYESVVGRKPFNGWDAETLRERMAAHLAGNTETKDSAGND